jgi:ubiquinone biosynthesis protein
MGWLKGLTSNPFHSKTGLSLPHQSKNVRQAFESLGPIFIRLGRLLIHRIGILSREVMNELKQIEDHGISISAKETVAIIEEELEKSIESVFEWFDETPLTITSLDQRHRAMTRSTAQDMPI